MASWDVRKIAELIIISSQAFFLLGLYVCAGILCGSAARSCGGGRIDTGAWQMTRLKHAKSVSVKLEVKQKVYSCSQGQIISQ